MGSHLVTLDAGWSFQNVLARAAVVYHHTSSPGRGPSEAPHVPSHDPLTYLDVGVLGDDQPTWPEHLGSVSVVVSERSLILVTGIKAPYRAVDARRRLGDRE